MSGGQQRYANVRFDDEGRIFNIGPNSITDELRTARLQQNAGDPNAGLTEEERAVRAALAAAADKGYINSHSQIPEAANQNWWRAAA